FFSFNFHSFKRLHLIKQIFIVQHAAQSSIAGHLLTSQRFCDLAFGMLSILGFFWQAQMLEPAAKEISFYQPMDWIEMPEMKFCRSIFEQNQKNTSHLKYQNLTIYELADRIQMQRKQQQQQQQQHSPFPEINLIWIKSDLSYGELNHSSLKSIDNL